MSFRSLLLMSYLTHRRFPAPGAAHDSVETFRMAYQRDSKFSGTHAIMADGTRVDQCLLVLASLREDEGL